MKRSDVLHTITNLKGEAGHKKVLEVYNEQNPLPRGYKLQEKDPWCAGTVTAVFLMNGYSDIAECSCTVMTKKAQDLGIWIEDDAYIPKCGDVIMYDWQDNGKGDNGGNPDHVGIVVRVNDNKITVREGNKAKTIGNRTIDVNGKFIRGYIVPPYDDDTDVSEDLKQEVSELSPVEEKPQEMVSSEVISPYKVGQTYTIQVRSALNVRKGAGKSYGLVGYAGLTPDGRKHAIGSALRNGTRVTVNEVKVISASEIWVKIPSGWICAVDGDRKYVV